MILRVNPNRMELLKLRRRLALAKRGHKLLQDKLEEMMRRFMLMLKDIDAAKEDFRVKTAALLRALTYCRITSSQEEFLSASGKVDVNLRLDVSRARIMNVSVPAFNLEELSVSRHYPLLGISGEFDLAVDASQEYIRSMLKLAGIFKSLEILSDEIERTRRRVNALEYMLIPSLQDTIRHINQKLNEFERGNLTRLMRVKDIVRAH